MNDRNRSFALSEPIWPRTPPRPVDAAGYVPELAGLARRTTRLHPERGAPTARQSSIGGPVLWPLDEPWPTCSIPWRPCDLESPGAEYDDDRPHQPPNPLLPVLQVFAADVPTIRFPPDADLLQVLWCPATHRELPGQPSAYAPAVRLFWRDSTRIGAVREGMPHCTDFEDELIPIPCVLRPEVVSEYPMDLPKDLWDRVIDLDEQGWNGTDLEYQYDLSVAPGSKAGGCAKWHAMDPFPMPCADCAGQLEMLICLDSREQYPGWDREADPHDVTGLVLGRGGDLQIFGCPSDPGHRILVLVQG